MERRLLNPKIDFVFKKIFGSDKRKGVLMSFLNAVLKAKNEITSVEIKNSDINKFSRLDVKAVTNKNEIINIEIHVNHEYNIIQRNLKLYEEQLEDSNRYDKLFKTVCINILDFKYLENDRFHNVYRLKEIETNKELQDIEEIHFIEIPKLKTVNSETEIVDMLQAWIEFLIEPESEVVRKLEMTNKEIREAKDELYRLSSDEKEREQYFMRENSIRDEISALANAKEKGIRKGMQLVIEQGIKKGIEQGKKEEQIKIAKSLLDILDIETISIKTGLSIKEVNKLKERR